MQHFSVAGVLFDLDGTLVDSAPDLVASANHALQQFQFPMADAEGIKPRVSQGAVAMLRYVTGDIEADQMQSMLDCMLDYYEQHIAVHSRLFDGILETLEKLEHSGIVWGVVTNKRTRFTLPLMRALGLSERAACMISGDTTAHSKPHPEPLRAACRQIGVDASQCVYIGDAAHDITAGRAADMKTLVAAYGYLNADDQPHAWGADGLIEHPQHLFNWIAS